MEQDEAVGGPHEGVGRAFRVRHHAENITLGVADSSDVAEGAIGVFDIAKDHAVFGFELVEDVGFGGVAAFAVSDGEAQDLPLGGSVCEGGIGGFDPEVDGAADELQLVVADEGAGEEAGFGENLEAIAEAHDKAAGVSEFLHGTDDGGEFRDGTAAEIVSVAEATGEDDGINIRRNGGFLMPEKRGLGAYVLRHGVVCIVIAITSREDDNAKFHRIPSVAIKPGRG